MTVNKTGTDYDPEAKTNRILVMTDNGVETIHFGVISQNAEHLEDEFHEEIDEIYEAHCPHCGHELDPDSPDYDIAWLEECPHCEVEIDPDDCYDDEPSSRVLRSGGYEGTVNSHGNLFLSLSKYYTNAQFCSPCYPGAGQLENPCEQGPKTFCLGHEWFVDEKAPYPVYVVKTGKLLVHV